VIINAIEIKYVSYLSTPKKRIRYGLSGRKEKDEEVQNLPLIIPICKISLGCEWHRSTLLDSAQDFYSRCINVALGQIE
jgi:hypothetical protein